MLVAKSLLSDDADVGALPGRGVREPVAHHPRRAASARGQPDRRDQPHADGRPALLAPHVADDLRDLLLAMDDPAAERTITEGLGFSGWLPVEPEDTEFMIDLMDTLLADWGTACTTPQRKARVMDLDRLQAEILEEMVPESLVNAQDVLAIAEHTEFLLGIEDRLVSRASTTPSTRTTKTAGGVRPGRAPQPRDTLRNWWRRTVEHPSTTATGLGWAWWVWSTSAGGCATR